MNRIEIAPTRVFGPDYLKINTVFKRDERNVIIPWDWTTEEFAYLADVEWRWTEKVDGTNIRVHWNGENVTVGGRTDNAQVPTFLIAALGFLNDHALWREVFPDANDVTVYGEGYGPKIQKGGQYRSDVSLAVFDMRVGEWWLKPEDVGEVCEKLHLTMVPFHGFCTLRQAVESVRDGNVKSAWPNAKIEGLVGRPCVDLYTRRGDRIVAKVKVKDFEDLRRRGTTP